MVRIYGTICGHRVSLYRQRASHNFLNYALVKKLWLTKIKSDHEYTIDLANGYDRMVWNIMVLGVPLVMQNYEQEQTLTWVGSGLMALVLG